MGSNGSIGGGLDKLHRELQAAAGGRWTGWRFGLLWTWVLLGAGMILVYVITGTEGLLTAGVLILVAPLALKRLLVFRAERRSRSEGTSTGSG